MIIDLQWFSMWVLAAGILLGWALGANDAASVFGPAVTSNIIKFRTAAIISSICIVAGALLQGSAGLETIGQLSGKTINEAFICMLCAGIVVTVMTTIHVPASITQAVIGAVIGMNLTSASIDWIVINKILICWVATPIGAAIASYFTYFIGVKICRFFEFNFIQMDKITRVGLVFCCMYGAYALGANHVAVITGVFVKANVISPFWGLTIGSISIAAGVLTYSKNVIRTIGKSLVPLTGFASFTSLLSASILIHIYAYLGVPVSSSQAIVGAVIGIGFTKGLYLINYKTLFKIFAGWLLNPIVSMLLCKYVITFVR